MKFFSGPESPRVNESKEAAVRLKHLKEGVLAIMACVGTHSQFEWDPGVEEVAFGERLSRPSRIHNVDYYARHDVLVEKNFKNSEKNSYVISPIDNLDKFSESFRNCLGLAVVGYEKETTENISFLSHQDPNYFLDGEANQNDFITDLEQSLVELKKRCDGGTIDAVIFGGNYFKAGLEDDYKKFQKEYLNSVGLLSDEVKKILGFEPIVITGPKTGGGEDDIFFENKTRRLYISRPKVGDDSTRSFFPNVIKKQKKKW